MTLKDKLELFVQKGWTYNEETGDCISPFGNIINRINKQGYITINTKQDKTINLMAHQLAWYITTGKVPILLDHRNRIKNDNHFSNLRVVTPTQNNFNRSNVKGYYWNKSFKKYHSRIMLNRKQISLGLFDCPLLAHLAYLEAKDKYHII